MELFKENKPKEAPAPLADRMRPRSLEEFVGQGHIVEKGRFLRTAIESDKIPSLILWGPPGSGKTTLANVIAHATGSRFVFFSAVLEGVKEVREIVKEAEIEFRKGKRTILFVDEIHRFNKAQQDAFLPHVEKGTIILIGATTENPSFEVNAPLLSRCRVLTLKPLTNDDLKSILKRALADMERGLGNLNLMVFEDAIDHLVKASHGDARTALNSLEIAAEAAKPDEKGGRIIGLRDAEEALQRKALLYDKGGEEHYNVISAFIKSMRGSDPDAALYWMARMLEAGEDPLFVARRMVIFASEDIGNADPHAISLAVSVFQAFHFLGMPEGWIPLAQAATYLATAPKSNASYMGYLSAKEDVISKGPLPVPLHIRNAPTKLMKDLGYSKGYKYPHNYGGYIRETYLPEELKGKSYYKPKETGYEKTIKEKMEKLKKENGQ